MPRISCLFYVRLGFHLSTVSPAAQASAPSKETSSLLLSRSLRSPQGYYQQSAFHFTESNDLWTKHKNRAKGDAIAHVTGEPADLAKGVLELKSLDNDCCALRWYLGKRCVQAERTDRSLAKRCTESRNEMFVVRCRGLMPSVGSVPCCPSIQPLEL